MKYLAVLLLAATALTALLAACQPLKSPIGDRPWVLVSYRGPDDVLHGAVAGTTVTALFDSKTGTVGGSGGCNSYSGRYEVDKLSLTIGPIAATARACLEPDRNAQETAFFQALQSAAEFRVGHNELTISGGGWTLNFIERVTTATGG